MFTFLEHLSLPQAVVVAAAMGNVGVLITGRESDDIDVAVVIILVIPGRSLIVDSASDGDVTAVVRAFGVDVVTISSCSPGVGVFGLCACTKFTDLASIPKATYFEHGVLHSSIRFEKLLTS